MSGGMQRGREESGIGVKLLEKMKLRRGLNGGG